MKYKLAKINNISAINDFQGLGREAATMLEKGEAVEIKNPPKHMVDNGFLVEHKTKGAK
tara:strand:+ start:3378 stop:3554 length:177 start_codon:yes stop_codon:yes gene_type:complete